MVLARSWHPDAFAVFVKRACHRQGEHHLQALSAHMTARCGEDKAIPSKRSSFVA